MNEIDLFKQQQEELLQTMIRQKDIEIQQKEAELKIRSEELAKNAELTKAALLNEQVNRDLLTQREKSNKLQQEHNKKLDELIESVQLLIAFLQDIKLDRKFSTVTDSQNFVVKALESLALVVLGRYTASPEELLKMAGSGIIKDYSETRASSGSYLISNIPTSKELTEQEMDTICEILLTSPTILDSFDDFLLEFRSEIKTGIKPNLAIKIKTRYLVRTCANYGELHLILKHLRRFEGDTKSVLELNNYMHKINRLI